MRRLLIILAAMCLPLVMQAQTDMEFGQQEENTYFLGFNLIPTASGGIINYLVVRVKDDKMTIIRNLSRENFIGQLTGRIESNANPENIDFMKQYNISNPFLVDSLWKLRYAEYPYRSTMTNKGWSGKSGMPSPEQLVILKEFGITQMSDVIYGDKALKLLQALDNAAWVEKYKRGY